MRSLGYSTVELLLTPLQFGVPNSRLRYYLLAKKKPLHFLHITEEDVDRVWRHIPGQGTDWVDDRSHHSTESNPHVPSLASYLDSPDETFNYTIPDQVLFKWGRLFDIACPSSRRSCCFTRGYTQLVQGSGSILQMNEALDTTAVFNQFLATRPESQDAVRILDSLQLRYFSPSELLRIFGFNPRGTDSAEPSNFRWPDTKLVSIRSRYKLIGNSVNVTLVQALIEYLFSE